MTKFKYNDRRRYVIAEMDGSVVRTAAVLEAEICTTTRSNESSTVAVTGRVVAVKQAEVASVEAFGRGVIAQHLTYVDTDGFGYDADLTALGEGHYEDEG